MSEGFEIWFTQTHGDQIQRDIVREMPQLLLWNYTETGG